MPPSRRRGALASFEKRDSSLREKDKVYGKRYRAEFRAEGGGIGLYLDAFGVIDGLDRHCIGSNESDLAVCKPPRRLDARPRRKCQAIVVDPEQPVPPRIEDDHIATTRRSNVLRFKDLLDVVHRIT